jgi:hypothetical protein
MNLRFLNSRKIINIIEMASQLILQIYHRDNFIVEIKEDKVVQFKSLFWHPVEDLGEDWEYKD